MFTTKELIEYNKGRIATIDSIIEEKKEEGDNEALLELKESRDKYEKRVKRYEQLEDMSGNTMHESFGCLTQILRTLDEYSHIENEIPEVKKIVLATHKELDAELTRRTHETLKSCSK